MKKGLRLQEQRKKIRDIESEEGRKLRLKLVEKRPQGKERELLFAIREELKGIREMLEEFPPPS